MGLDVSFQQMGGLRPGKTLTQGECGCGPYEKFILSQASFFPLGLFSFIKDVKTAPSITAMPSEHTLFPLYLLPAAYSS